MIHRLRRHDPDAERLARQLLVPGTVSTDETINDLVRTSHLLEPGVFPRETSRQANLQRALRALNRQPEPTHPASSGQPAGSQDGLGGGVRVARVTHHDYGMVGLADVEPIDSERAAKAAAALARIAATRRPAGL